MSMEFDDYRPIFLQLAEMLEDAILSGVYREEDQVPSITEYSVAYKINPATALKGVNLLVDSGLLYKKRGVGMFVAPGAKEKLLQNRRQKFFESRLLPVVWEARALGLSPAELEEMMKRGMKDGD